MHICMHICMLSVVHVVPLTSTLRGFGSEITVDPDRERP